MASPAFDAEADRRSPRRDEDNRLREGAVAEFDRHNTVPSVSNVSIGCLWASDIAGSHLDEPTLSRDVSIFTPFLSDGMLRSTTPKKMQDIEREGGWLLSTTAKKIRDVDSEDERSTMAKKTRNMEVGDNVLRSTRRSTTFIKPDEES